MSPLVRLLNHSCLRNVQSECKLWLTLSNDKWWIEEEVAHQLSWQLTKEVWGSGAIKEDSPIPHSVDQWHSRRGCCLRDTQHLGGRKTGRVRWGHRRIYIFIYVKPCKIFGITLLLCANLEDWDKSWNSRDDRHQRIDYCPGWTNVKIIFEHYGWETGKAWKQKYRSISPMHNYWISFNVECTLVFQLIKINTNIASLNIINLHLRSSPGLKGKAGYTKGQFCTNCTQFASVWSCQNCLNRTVIFQAGDKPAKVTSLLMCCERYLVNPSNHHVTSVGWMILFTWQHKVSIWVRHQIVLIYLSTVTPEHLENHDKTKQNTSSVLVSTRYLNRESAVGVQHFGLRFREHLLEPLFHHLGEPTGPRIITCSHKLQHWNIKTKTLTKLHTGRGITLQKATIMCEIENTNLISGCMYLNSCNILISSSDLVSQDVFIFLLLKPSFHWAAPAPDHSMNK